MYQIAHKKVLCIYHAFSNNLPKLENYFISKWCKWLKLLQFISDESEILY